MPTSYVQTVLAEIERLHRGLTDLENENDCHDIRLLGLYRIGIEHTCSGLADRRVTNRLLHRVTVLTAVVGPLVFLALFLSVVPRAADALIDAVLAAPR